MDNGAARNEFQVLISQSLVKKTALNWQIIADQVFFLVLGIIAQYLMAKIRLKINCAINSWPRLGSRLAKICSRLVKSKSSLGQEFTSINHCANNKQNEVLRRLIYNLCISKSAEFFNFFMRYFFIQTMLFLTWASVNIKGAIYSLGNLFFQYFLFHFVGFTTWLKACQVLVKTCTRLGKSWPNLAQYLSRLGQYFQVLVKTCARLVKRHKICQDLGIDIGGARSKKWHAQSSETVLIQLLQLHWICTV